ncbi:MAG: hypothetical protein QXO58_02740, partial [Thermoplasmata archaeon]
TILKKLFDLISENTNLLYLDECHFNQHGSRYRILLTAEDRDPVILQEHTRNSIRVFGSVNSRNGQFRQR